MTALMTAAALNLSPSLWRDQLGPWRPEEMQALEATAVVLAGQLNGYEEDDTGAARLVTDVRTKAETDQDGARNKAEARRSGPRT